VKFAPIVRVSRHYPILVLDWRFVALSPIVLLIIGDLVFLNTAIVDYHYLLVLDIEKTPFGVFFCIAGIATLGHPLQACASGSDLSSFLLTCCLGRGSGFVFLDSCAVPSHVAGLVAGDFSVAPFIVVLVCDRVP
jgi:hypothetical protein